MIRLVFPIRGVRPPFPLPSTFPFPSPSRRAMVLLNRVQLLTIFRCQREIIRCECQAVRERLRIINVI